MSFIIFLLFNPTSNSRDFRSRHHWCCMQSAPMVVWIRRCSPLVCWLNCCRRSSIVLISIRRLQSFRFALNVRQFCFSLCCLPPLMNLKTIILIDFFFTNNFNLRPDFHKARLPLLMNLKTILLIDFSSNNNFTCFRIFIKPIIILSE